MCLKLNECSLNSSPDLCGCFISGKRKKSVRGLQNLVGVEARRLVIRHRHRNLALIPP